MDLDWLERNHIAWANAPGCNADSTAQYTLAMIALACERLGRVLTGLTAAVIGRGNVGSRVQVLLQELGLSVLANDPPLADAGESGLAPLDQALAQDIVCLHVPLTNDGPYPTRGMIDRDALARMRDNALLVNTSRGDVVDGQALLDELQGGRLHAALDVWPGEPRMDARLVHATTVATPHVAGYSADGKLRGTLMVYRAFCHWAGLQPVPDPAIPQEPPRLHIPAGQAALTSALDAACFVRRHDSQMRALADLPTDLRAAQFDRLRRDYPLRRDFGAWQVHVDDAGSEQTLRRLGFHVPAHGPLLAG